MGGSSVPPPACSTLSVTLPVMNRAASSIALGQSTCFRRTLSSFLKPSTSTATDHVCPSGSARTSLMRSVMILGGLPSAGVKVVMSSNISTPYVHLKSFSQSLRQFLYSWLHSAWHLRVG